MDFPATTVRYTSMLKINDQKLEELEDFYVVRERLEKPFVTVSNDDVWKELGLVD